MKLSSKKNNPNILNHSFVSFVASNKIIEQFIHIKKHLFNIVQ